MKRLLLIPALTLTLSPLPAASVGWSIGWFDIFNSTNNPLSVPVNDGVFAGAQPKSTPVEPEPTPAPEPDPVEPDPVPEPAPTGSMTSISLTETGLLDFVFQQLYAGVDSAESDRIRAVLAPQYASLAQYLQTAFNGAEALDPPADVMADPAPTTDPVEDVSITSAMAVVAVTSLLNQPDQTADPAPVPLDGGSLRVLSPASFSGVQMVTSSVPEPSTFVLLAAGLALVGVRRRRA